LIRGLTNALESPPEKLTYAAPNLPAKIFVQCKKMLAIAPAPRVVDAHVAAQQIFSAFPAGT
jgi:hypothetical protein